MKGRVVEVVLGVEGATERVDPRCRSPFATNERDSARRSWAGDEPPGRQEGVEVNVEVDRRTEALDDGDRCGVIHLTGRCRSLGEPAIEFAQEGARYETQKTIATRQEQADGKR